MHRQFESLLLASEGNVQETKLSEELFIKLKVDVRVVVDSVYDCVAENDQQASVGNQIIPNLKSSRKKDQRNVSGKSTSENMSDIV